MNWMLRCVMRFDVKSRLYDSPKANLARVALSGLLILVALVAAGPASAQAPAKVSVNGVTVSGSSFTASVTVADSTGKPVAGLTDASFTVEVDGQPVASVDADSNVDT